MDDSFNFGQMLTLVIHFGCRVANGQCLSEFEYMSYEAACRHLKSVQDIKRIACERWIEENDKAAETN